MALNEFVQTALDEEGYEEGSDGQVIPNMVHGMVQQMRTGVEQLTFTCPVYMISLSRCSTSDSLSFSRYSAVSHNLSVISGC